MVLISAVRAVCLPAGVLAEVGAVPVLVCLPGNQWELFGKDHNADSFFVEAVRKQVFGDKKILLRYRATDHFPLATDHFPFVVSC